MKKKTIFAFAGIAAGIIMIICGLTVLGGDLGVSEMSYGRTATTMNSGFASFGADFYTYVTNNAAEAANASRAAAANLVTVAKLIKMVSGIALLCFGMISVCHFGMNIDFDELSRPNGSKTSVNPSTTETPKPESIPEASTEAQEGQGEAPLPSEQNGGLPSNDDLTPDSDNQPLPETTEEKIETLSEEVEEV